MFEVRHPLVGALLVLNFAVGLPIQTASAQITNPELTYFPAPSIDIELDGLLDESIWADVPAMSTMWVVSPDTLAEPSEPTDIRVFYTERGIYIGVDNHQAPATLVARMSSRDREVQRDGFRVAIDPSGTGLYGYSMRINLGDSLNDATLLPERLINQEWDGAWNARSQETDSGWSAEIYVPWSMMTLPQAVDSRIIGLYFEREVAALGEIWSWPALPDTGNNFLSDFRKFRLRDVQSESQLTYYPYVSSTLDSIADEMTYRVGTELFWRPSSNMQLAATINPDFGNVESDDVVVNLTAFETFFPEKRPFFLEGQDIFNTHPRSEPGPRAPTAMLNTRRIGRAPNFTIPNGVTVRATDLSEPTDLTAAAKLTGQNGSMRYGALLASEENSELLGRDSNGDQVRLLAKGRDYAVGRLLYEQSTGSGRRSIGWMGTAALDPQYDAYVNGIDLHYFSADAVWTIDAQVLHSNVGGETGSGGFVDYRFQPERGVQHRIRSTYIDATFDMNDLGFLSRNDHVQVDYDYSKTVSDIPGLRSLTTGYQIVNQWNTAGYPVRLGLLHDRTYTFMDNSRLRVDLRYFNPRTDDRLGRGTGTFRVPERWNVIFNWRSDQSTTLGFGLVVDANQGDLGKKDLETTATVNFRPAENFASSLSVLYSDKEDLLVHKGNGNYTSFESNQWAPKFDLDYFIDAKKQLRLSLQWTGLKAFEDQFWRANPNSVESLIRVDSPDDIADDFRISRLTFQARYRWEIAPLSDLFIVYTRGANLPGNQLSSFGDSIEQAWSEPLVDKVTVKLRYRFGS